MPKGPQGQKRPADAIARAVMVAKIATGEVEDACQNDGKNQAAKTLGAKGGKARALKLSGHQRASIAKKGAQARWKDKEPV